jgi:hypothetical protein
MMDTLEKVKCLSLSVVNKLELYELVIKEVKPTEEARSQNAEILTPLSLAQEMTDRIPAEFWNTAKKVFEPTCGKGVFLCLAYEKFLASGIPKKTILEECLYFADLNPVNVYICKLLLDPLNEYALNYHIGDTLKLDVEKTFNVKQFNAVIGNPPYNNSSGNGGSRKIWDKFVHISLDDWLLDNGYLVFVHPPVWRKPDNKVLHKIKNNNLLFLKYYNDKECLDIFKCNTKVDYYVLQKCEYKNFSNINGTVLNIAEWNFIPNCNYDIFENIRGISSVLCPNTSYSSDMKWMKDEILANKYILTINKAGITYKYSSLKKNYINNKKVILSLGRYPYPFNDYNGEYGLSCYTFGIEIDDKEHGDNIILAIKSDKFTNLLKNNKFGSYNIDWRMFKYFKKDFWRDFVV